MKYLLQDCYEYELPEVPAQEKILFHDLPQEEQYWRHPKYDFEKINSKWTDEQKKHFVVQELERRINGCWFMNNGVPTYITGSHYFFLVYFKVPVHNIGMAYPAFRNYQKEIFYFLDFVDKDKYCEGAAISKPRRVGATAIINADVMNLSMLRSDRIFSIQNKKLDEAQRFNYAPIKFNAEHFPSIKTSKGDEIFSPRVSTGNIQNRRLRWGISVRDRGELGDDELNTQIYIVPSVQNADDGGQAHRLIRDEVSKYDAKINISTMLSILRPVAQTGTVQVGKIIFFCTSDVEDSPNFEEWKRIYNNSDYTLRERRKTKSGLYKYFISAKYSLAGDIVDENDNSIELFDIYGNCNEELAIDFLMRDRRKAKDEGDLGALQRIRRNYPINEEDAFESGEGTACYDTLRLAEQLYNIEQREKKVMSGIELPFVTKGRLEWDIDENGRVLIDRKVRFIPNTVDSTKIGHWAWYELPNERWKNKNSIDYYNFLCPDDTSPNLVTVDPFAYREQVEGGSKGAIVIGTMIDSMLSDMGGKISATWCHRPSNPNELIEEVRKAIIFVSGSAFVENNKEWLAVDLIKGRDDQNNNRPNYGKFLLTYDNGKFRRWRVGDKIAGISNQGKSIEAYVRDTNTFLREPKNETDFDYLRYVMDKDIIRQWMRFDATDTQKFDLAVAASMYCMLLQNYQRVLKPVEATSDSMILRNFYGIKAPIQPLGGNNTKSRIAS